MRKILYSLLIFASVTVFAQKNPTIKFAVSNDMVGTVSIFENQKNFIKSMHVYKTAAQLPANLKKFSFLADKGLTEFKYKPDAGPMDHVSLAEYNQKHNLPENNPVIIEGYEFTNTETRIFAEIAQQLEVKDRNGVKTLYITTTQK